MRQLYGLNRINFVTQNKCSNFYYLYLILWVEQIRSVNKIFIKIICSPLLIPSKKERVSKNCKIQIWYRLIVKIPWNSWKKSPLNFSTQLEVHNNDKMPQQPWKMFVRNQYLSSRHKSTAAKKGSKWLEFDEMYLNFPIFLCWKSSRISIFL
jgi:hypothetical protein